MVSSRCRLLPASASYRLAVSERNYAELELPEGTDVHVLLDRAAEHDVTFVKGTDFLLEGGENTLRLARMGSEAIRVLAEADKKGS